MSRHLGLTTRVKRLEKRLGRRKPLPTIIMGIYPEEQGGPILGIEGEGELLRLKAGQSLAELRRIAAATLPGRFLRIAYGPARTTPEGASEPSPVPGPMNAPSGPAWPSMGDPGVGARATAEQLRRMGALAVPPERII